DGDLDMILTGVTGVSTFISRIYVNNGSGSFSEINPGNLQDLNRSASVLGDLDNDGDLDLILAGSSDDSMNSGGWSGIYQNDGSGNFTLINTGQLPGVLVPELVLGDLDNDGDLDLIIVGWDSGSDSWISKIFQNNGSGSFSEINSGQLVTSHEASLSLGDFDNDGDLDLIMTGGAAMSNYSRIYQNDGSGSFTEINAGQLTPMYSSDCVLGDLDNDGDLDLILSGDSTNPITECYINNGSGNFTRYYCSPVSNALGSEMVLGDFDNDGDLDLILTGSPDATHQMSKVYRNIVGTSNTAPSVPAGLTVQSVSGFWNFSWTASTDDHTSNAMLRYNIAVSTSGSGIYNYISDAILYPPGQATVGNIPENGVVAFQSSIPDSVPIWFRVCAIDTSFKYSGYSEECNTLILAPDHLLADAVSLNEINLTWNDNSDNEDGFRIERRDGDAGVWTQIGSVGAGVTSYSDTSGLTRGINYYYRVYAWNTAGNSGYSNEVQVFFEAPVEEFKVYPNPVKPGDTVRFTNLNGPGSIKILDTYGNLIKEISFTGTEATWDLTGNVDPGSGVYIYYIKDNNGKKTGKIIILK
ncbi:MAG: FG-GAP-like repeat-containing protein, partial [bacterium]|nr:FG-GAP-like repeat-containing protein [bacterium]